MAIQRQGLSAALAAVAALIVAGLAVTPAAAQSQAGQQRPELPDERIYATDRFLIHYTLKGKDAVNPRDDDNNGTPDYVDQIAQTVEYVWNVEINQMGWAPPPHDHGEGGDNRFDVYLQNIMPDSIAGYTQSEGGYIGDNPETPERERRAAYSYLALDNDYQEAEGTGIKPLDLMKVTVAHEFNHVIQAGYDDFDPQTWLYEATAVWMETQVYPDISDSRNYLPDIMNAPDTCRTAKSAWYGSWLFVEMLAEKHGRDIVRSIWESSRQLDGYSAIDAALKPYNSSLVIESRAFAVANLLRSYTDGRDYPTVRLAGSFEQGTFTPDNGVQSLGADYVQLTGRNLLRVTFHGGKTLFGELVGIHGSEADTFDLSQPVTVDLGQYSATFVVVHDDEEALNEDACKYRDYNIDVSPASGSPSAAVATIPAENFREPSGGGGSVTSGGNGPANAGSGVYHPPYSGGSNTGAMTGSPQGLEVPFPPLIPARPPIGYEFNYAYIMTAADFGSSADYYVPGGDKSANYDFVSQEGNWMSITESLSPYKTIQEWLDGVGYQPQGSTRTVDGVEVLVEDLSSGDQTSISATIIYKGLFIVIDGDHSEDDVLEMVQAIITAGKPPEAQGGTQFPAPDVSGSQATATSVPVSQNPLLASTSLVGVLGIGLCGLGACLLAVGAVLVVGLILRRRP